MVNRFGRRLYRTFFKTYTEKVWGIPCRQLRADWAAQRIKGLSMWAVVSNALFGAGNSKSLIKEFHYPVLGPGMMWQRFQEAVESGGGRVWLGAEVVRLEWDGRRVAAVVTRRGGQLHRITADQVISSMPLAELISCLDPLPPSDVLAAARGLKYRDFVLVGLIVNHAKPFPDNWIYVHEPEVRVGRIQNFRNWSAAMVADPQKTSLGMEYFCYGRGCDLADARRRADRAGAPRAGRPGLGGCGHDVEDGFVIRQPKAYPVYDEEYEANLAVLVRFLATIDNLQTIGRNGMHRYNNQDHSMLTGILAVRNLRGVVHNLWDVNSLERHHEEASAAAKA